MSAQPIDAASAPPLRILPIPDHAVPALPIDAPDPLAIDERQLEISLDLVNARGTLPRLRRHPPPTPVRARPRPRRSSWDEDDDEPLRSSERPTSLEDLRRWVAKLVPAMLEAAAGTRSAPQLMRWVSPSVYEGLVRRHTRALRRGTAVRRPLTVLRVVLNEPNSAIVEASVVFTDGQRVRAAALRFVPVDRRWVADAFEVG